MRYQIKHSKRNSICTCTHVLCSIYFVRLKYHWIYSRCETLFCSQTWYKAVAVASAHNYARYMLLLHGNLILSYLVTKRFSSFVGETSNYLKNEPYSKMNTSIWTTYSRSLNNFVFPLIFNCA